MAILGRSGIMVYQVVPPYRSGFIRESLRLRERPFHFENHHAAHCPVMCPVNQGRPERARQVPHGSAADELGYLARSAAKQAMIFSKSGLVLTSRGFHAKQIIRSWALRNGTGNRA